MEGQGVGTDDSGNIYFVPRALPGDRVLVEVADDAGRYRDAELIEVVRPTPDREPPRCPYFHACGGCDWLHWSYAKQLEAKDASLTHILERAQLKPLVRKPILPSPEQYGYRNRVQLRAEGGRMGYYRRGSHEIVDVEKCAVAHPAINAKLDEMRVRLSPKQHKYELGLSQSGTVKVLTDAPHGAGGFTQINGGQNANLRALVAAHIADAGAAHVLELFCGDGNLTFAYLDKVKAVVGVDSSGPAITLATDRAKALGAPATFLRGGVTEALPKRLPRALDDFDTLLLDPPRTGMGPVLEQLVSDSLRTIVYVSCNPVAFTKDIAPLRGLFELCEVQALDMFPHTRHIELIATLKRI